jgi:S-adenosylmethionine hydrolase
MAPAAAYLSLGIDPSCLGRARKNLVSLAGVEPVRRGRKWIGKIIWIDRFGNLITSISANRRMGRKTVILNGEKIGPIRATFADVRTGRPLAYIGSGGHLEIAVRDGSAREFFGITDPGKAEIQVAPA